MKPSILLAAALTIIPGVSAVDPSKSAIIWFEDDATPDWVLNEAKDNIIKAGGKITHSYSIIKGFAVVAPSTALQSVQAWGSDHAMKVEEDDVVSIDD
jgi:hypothetical protein